MESKTVIVKVTKSRGNQMGICFGSIRITIFFVDELLVRVEGSPGHRGRRSWASGSSLEPPRLGLERLVEEARGLEGHPSQ